jgi:hypothetical protein
MRKKTAHAMVRSAMPESSGHPGLKFPADFNFLLSKFLLLPPAPPYPISASQRFSVSVFVDFCFFAHTLVPVLFRDFRDFRGGEIFFF